MPPNQQTRIGATAAARVRHASDESSSEPAVAASVDAFRRILRALRLAATRTHAVAGLSAAQLFVLRALQDDVEASLSQIAARTMTDRTSVAAVVERLLAAGLVARGRSGEDRRRAAITMTLKGRNVLRRAPEPPTALLVAGLRRIDPAQLDALADGLGALTGAMGLSEQNPGMLFEDGGDPPTRRAVRRKVQR